MAKSVKIALMFGASEGDFDRTFREAREALVRAGLAAVRTSSIYRGPAVDCVPGTPDFGDMALTGEWPGSEEELLTLCQELERRAGRPAVHSSRESRVLDIDLILFGDRVRHDPRLTLPHPRAQQREFVLKPLAQIAPELRFPDSGRTVAECLQNLSKEN